MELQVIAVIDQRGQLSVLAIVADANNGTLSFFDYFAKLSDTASISRAHSIYFVHHNDHLSFRASQIILGYNIVSLMLFSFGNTALCEIVYSLISYNCT